MSFLEVAEIVGSCYDPPSRIEYAAREIPLSHRYFDVKRLRTAFPDFQFTSLRENEKDIHHNRQFIASTS